MNQYSARLILFTTAASPALVLAQACPGPSLLDLPSRYAIGRQPTAVECGDVNNDGVQDIVSVNHYLEEFWVTLLDERGNTISRTAFDTEPYGNDLVLADFDLDGDIDVAIANRFDGELAVHTNDGSGGFASYTTLTSALRPHTVVSADMNNDGRPDLVCTPGSTASVAVLYGQPDGEFSNAQLVDTHDISSWVEARDLNSDGLPDLVYAQHEAIEVRINLGGDAYSSPAVYEVAGPIRDADVGDMDGDGDLDIALLIDDGDELVLIQMLEQHTPGIFTASSTLEMGYWRSAQELAVGDVLGDSSADIVVSDLFGTAKVSVYESLGAGGFAPPQTFSVHGSYPNDIDLHDMDNDGRLDILTANGTSDTVVVLPNVENRDFRTTRVVGIDDSFYSVRSVDIDADGDQDILARTFDSEQIVIAKNDGRGVFSQIEQIPSGPGVGLFDIEPIDLLGRGVLDLVTIKRTSYRMSLFVGDGQGAFQFLETYPIGRNAIGAIVEDVDGDGDPDVLVQYDESYRGPDLYLNQGFFSLTLVGEIETGWRFVAMQMLDMDDDGDSDIIGIDFGDVRVFYNDGSGSFEPGDIIPTGAFCNSLVCDDINGDQQPDLVVGSSVEDELRVILSDGSGGYLQPQVIPDQRGSSQLKLVDVDLDGNLDISFHTSTQGMRVLFNPGDHQYSQQLALNHPFINAYVRFDIADYTGDGRPDFIQADDNELFLNPNVCEIADEPCIADLNDDGQLNFFDVTAFISLFNTMSPGADFNGDGSHNFFDVSEFLVAFNAGCP